ncbi:DNA damage-binding protein 1 [Artemisia annua]|uniref:DNA damage-binding protein 1 n=1 Tax=Artemisia annua TaxID=35608 RepID=A0A2U1M892_ARTAN|nr:DNA damage-binding protein 1 [Artemisia annua]
MALKTDDDNKTMTNSFVSMKDFKTGDLKNDTQPSMTKSRKHAKLQCVVRMDGKTIHIVVLSSSSLFIKMLLSAGSGMFSNMHPWNCKVSKECGRLDQQVYDIFMVVSVISETRILAMNLEDELEEDEIEGFNSQVQTLFIHDIVHNQLVQLSKRCINPYLGYFKLGIDDNIPTHVMGLRDIQEILWERLNIIRESYGLTRLAQYRNYENILLPGDVVDKV